MMDRCRRRWAIIETTSTQLFVFDGRGMFFTALVSVGGSWMLTFAIGLWKSGPSSYSTRYHGNGKYG